MRAVCRPPLTPLRGQGRSLVGRPDHSLLTRAKFDGTGQSNTHARPSAASLESNTCSMACRRTWNACTPFGYGGRAPPQRRHPAPASAGQGPTGRRRRRQATATATAGHALRRPRLRPRQVPAAAVETRHPARDRGTRTAARLWPGYLPLGRRAADPTSWLHGFRRLRIRWERLDDIHEAFLGLATCLITHRHVQRLC